MQINRRLAEHLGPVKSQLNSAVDKMMGLSENLTQSLNLVNLPIRKSLQGQLPLNRSSSIGAAFHQMRPVTKNGASNWNKEIVSSSSNNSPKQLSKVHPMVAGHAISRPRIQLTRMDRAAMDAARSQQEELVPNGSREEYDNNVTVSSENRVEPEEEAVPSFGRDAFNLTNIGEEGSFIEDESLTEHSFLHGNSMSDLQEPSLDTLPENDEIEVSPNVSFTRRSRCSIVVPAGAENHSLQLSDRNSGLTNHRTSRGLSRPPLEELNSLSSPQVDILKTQRHPAVVLCDLVTMKHPALPPSNVESTPLAAPMISQSSNSSHGTSDFPLDPSESFLERMCDADPLEGPSWLFASVKKKKKRRSSAARKLSVLLSDSERDSVQTNSGRSVKLSKNEGVFNSSDINLPSEAEEILDDSSDFELDQDLLENAVMLTPQHESEKSVFDDNMDLTSNNDDQENNPLQVSGGAIDENNLSISVSQGSRTPLSSLTYTDKSGEVFRFNPRTDTGVTVAGLRQAHILLNNVGMESSSERTTPYKL